MIGPLAVWGVGMVVLGAVLAQPARAEAISAFYAQRLERIGHQLDRIIGECEQIRAALGGGQDGAGELSEAERAQLLNLGYLGEEP